MDEVEGLRLKPSSEDLVSLAESINLEGQLVIISQMRGCWKPLSQHHHMTLTGKNANQKIAHLWLIPSYEVYSTVH